MKRLLVTALLAGLAAPAAAADIRQGRGLADAEDRADLIAYLKRATR